MMRGRVVDADKILAEAFEGHAEGAVRIDLDQPTHAMARIGFTDLSGDKLAEMFPLRLVGLTGKFSGAASIEPSVAQRAVEPMRLRATIHPENAKYRTVDIGDARFSVFIGDERFVMDKLPSEHDEPWNVINMAGGQVSVWARVSQQVDRRTQSHFTISFKDLDLDSLVHAAAPDAHTMPGLLNGSFTLFGSPRDLEHAFGDGNVQIRNSDLANAKAVKPLYDANNVSLDGRAPTGRGEMHARLEASTLTFDSVRYFNRGLEIRAQPTISDVWHMPDSPLSGTAVGSARPLRDIHLPLLADVDQVLNVLQSNLTTVELGGTVRDPDVRPIPFSEVNSDMKRFLLGDVNSEVRKKE